MRTLLTFLGIAAIFGGGWAVLYLILHVVAH